MEFERLVKPRANRASHMPSIAVVMAGQAVKVAASRRWMAGMSIVNFFLAADPASVAAGRFGNLPPPCGEGSGSRVGVGGKRRVCGSPPTRPLRGHPPHEGEGEGIAVPRLQLR